MLAPLDALPQIILIHVDHATQLSTLVATHGLWMRVVLQKFLPSTIYCEELIGSHATCRSQNIFCNTTSGE
jgi:hypothetical protein